MTDNKTIDGLINIINNLQTETKKLKEQQSIKELIDFLYLGYKKYKYDMNNKKRNNNCSCCAGVSGGNLPESFEREEYFNETTIINFIAKLDDVDLFKYVCDKNYINYSCDDILLTLAANDSINIIKYLDTDRNLNGILRNNINNYYNISVIDMAKLSMSKRVYDYLNNQPMTQQQACCSGVC